MTPIFFHPDQNVAHDFISTRKVPEFVRQSGREPVVARPATAVELQYAHDPAYLDAVMTLRDADGFGKRKPEMVRYALASSGSFLAAAEHIALGLGPVACSASQGFHHAHYDHNYGYCTFNALVAAAAQAVNENFTDSVLILDGDGHHGDGTDDCVERAGLQRHIHNVTCRQMRRFSDASSSQWYDWVCNLIETMQPGIILYQAGADAWEKDPYGVGYLSRLGMMQRDRGIFKAAKDKGVGLVWNLAGGYSNPMQDTLDLHLQTLRMSDEVYYGTPN